MQTFLLLSFTFLFNCEAIEETIHNFYLSICQIDHNEENASLEIAIKVFTDDFEEALEDLYATSLQLGTAEEDTFADTYIQQYLVDKLQLSVNGEKRNLLYVGKEVGWDDTWLYVEVEDIQTVEQLEITNRLLLEIFEEQQNTVHFNSQEHKETFIFHKGKVKHVWKQS